MKKRVTVTQAIEMAAGYAREGNPEKAAGLYRQVLRMQPDNAEAQRALDSLPLAAKKDGFSSDMHKLLGLYGSGRLDEAKHEAERMTGLYPSQPMPHNLKGAIFMAQGQAEQAIDCIKTAVRLAPEYAEAWANLGSAQFDAGYEDEAVGSFRKALELDQSPALVASANRGLGKVLATQGKFSDARNAFEKALSLQPEDTVTRIALGMALRERGWLKESVDELEKALEFDPESSLAHLELGLSLRRLSRDEEGLEILQRGLELDPENATGHLYLGHFYLKMGDKEMGAKALRRCLELDPGSVEAQHFLNAAEGIQTASAPAEFVEKEFDDYSARFDQQLVGTLKYRGPAVLAEMLHEYGANEFASAVDLGCGTGLMGKELGEKTGYLLGVDLSSKMLAKAGERGVYDELERGDIVQVLASSDRTFDLVVSADVLIYVGDLLPVMRAVAEKITPAGLLAISTELYAEADQYRLLDTGRFAHGEDYVIGVAAEAGLALQRFEATDLRKEGGNWLTGGFYLFAKDQ